MTTKKPKAGPINHFLLVYDRAAGLQVEVRQFGTDSAGAVAAYQEVERQYVDNPRMDIVLVGSDSLDTVRVTHSNYFDEGVATLEQVEQFLRGFSALYGRADPAPRSPVTPQRHASSPKGRATKKAAKAAAREPCA